MEGLRGGGAGQLQALGARIRLGAATENDLEVLVGTGIVPYTIELNE